MIRQAASLEVTSIRHRNDIEKFTLRTQRYFIDFESRSEVSTYNFDVDWMVNPPRYVHWVVSIATVKPSKMCREEN